MGPEQLIKMATGQLPDASSGSANGDTCETNNASDLSRPSRLGPNAASRVLRAPMRSGR